MSSCLSGGGGGRTYGFDLVEMVKSPSPSIRSSSPSSTLSEASNSPRTLSTKRARTPRKRPNQAYTEAAALLSTVYPKVFPAKIPGRMCRHRRSHDSSAEPSELLPSFPGLGDAAFLIRDPPIEAPSSFSFHLEPKPPANFTDKECRSSPANGFRQPGSPGPLEEDLDAKSILDEETGEGIDSIMGNLSMDSIVCTSTHHANPQFRSLMGLGLGGRFELGLGLRCNLRRALRNTDNGDWWRSPTVAMLDIVPKFQALPPPSQSEKKTRKKKKKKKKDEVKELPSTASTNINTITSIEELRSSLLLKLNHEEVLKEWSDRGSPYAASDASSSPESTADILARLSEIDLFPEEGAGGGAGGIREASVMRYKEKRRSRLFSKKIRYQVRKVNADQRPRMKASGRFVKRTSSSLLKEAIEQENL